MSQPKAPLTKERIVDASLDLVDNGGISSLSMRKIAEPLGVKAMSLYNHVSGKDEIVEALLERIVAEFEVPDTSGPWKQEMLRRGNGAHRVLKKRPWAIQALMTSRTAGPNMLRYVNGTIGCLVEAGFSYETADHAWNAMDNHIYGFTLQEVNFPFAEPEYADAAKEFLPRLDTEEYPYFTALASRVLEKQYSGVHDFEFGLNLILDGLERLLVAPGSGPA